MSQSSSYAGILPEETVLHLRGTGIPGFLQGQLTCDLRQLTPGRSVMGALCDVRGRVLSDLRVVQVNDGHCLLRLRSSLAQALAERLGLYARFSRISVSADDGGLRVAVARGDAAAALLDPLGLRRPEPEAAVAASGGSLCIARFEDACELLLQADQAAQLSGLLADNGLAAQAWPAAELAGGLYRIDARDSGEFTPQALNYDRAGLVSFSKGCYTGQEVIARLHYRGQSKRRLALLEASDPGMPLQYGAAITEDDGGTVVGTLLRCERNGDGSLLCAAMLRDRSTGSSNGDRTLRLQGTSTALRILPLPYRD
jgi:folate-binding protein YgfZ